MTFMQKAIMAAIKEHNNDPENTLAEYNKGIKLLSMEPDRKRGAHIDTWHNNWHEDTKEFERVDDAALRLKVKCSFKPTEKYAANVVIYEVIIYSEGTIGVYYDGEEYAA